MESETEKKLTGLQHQIEMLRTDMEANVRTMKTSAIDRLRMDMERGFRIFLLEVACVVGGVTAIVSFIVG